MRQSCYTSVSIHSPEIHNGNETDRYYFQLLSRLMQSRSSYRGSKFVHPSIAMMLRGTSIGDEWECAVASPGLHVRYGRGNLMVTPACRRHILEFGKLGVDSHLCGLKCICRGANYVLYSLNQVKSNDAEHDSHPIQTPNSRVKCFPHYQ